MFINGEYRNFDYYKDCYNDLRKFISYRNNYKNSIYVFFRMNKEYGDLAINSIHDFLSICDYVNIYELRFILEYIGKSDDKELLDSIFEKHDSIFFRDVKDVLYFRQKNVRNYDEIIDFLKKANKDHYNTIAKYGWIKDMDIIYDNSVPDDIKCDPKFITALLDKFPKAFLFVYKYIPKKDIYKILDEHYVDIYVGDRKNCLTKEEYDYLIELFNKNRDKIVDALLEEKRCSSYHYNAMQHREHMDNEYNIIVPDNLKHNPKFISSLLDKFPTAFPFIYKYIDKKDIYNILDKHYAAAYKYFVSSNGNTENVTDEEYSYIVNKIKESNNKELLYFLKYYDSIFERIILSHRSNIIEKLRKKFGKSYNEYAIKNNIEPEDDLIFIQTILKNKCLKDIYFDDYFDLSDIKVVDAIINYFEDEKIDCMDIRKRIKVFKEEAQKRDIYIYNQILINKNNEQKLNELLTKLNVNKDNFFEFIKKRKYLDKKMKEAALLTLAKHFKTGYISIYDIIDLLQEMSERELTIDEILKEKQIDKKIFYSIYDKFKEEKPKMYELISKHLKNNKLRGYKKLIKMYYSIMNDKIKDYNSFIEKYGYTPEEIVKMFVSTDFYDDIFKTISTWYHIKDDFNNGDSFMPHELIKK